MISVHFVWKIFKPDKYMNEIFSDSYLAIQMNCLP